MSITCKVCANDDQWHYNQLIPYNLWIEKRYKLWTLFFLVTSSHYKASLFSYEFNVVKSMNRPWRLILYIAYMFCYFRFFFIDELLLFLLVLLFFLLFLLISFLCARHWAFEHVVQNEEFNLKRSSFYFILHSFSDVHVEVHFFLSFSLVLDHASNFITQLDIFCDW